MNRGAALERTRIMGVLNVTPDSFSDGGQYLDPGAAVARARELVRQGAQLIDVGGESTRPGAERVTPAQEQRRVLPVIEALAAEGITVSIDTVHADTARLAVAAGASIINDVSGGTADPEMLPLAAETGVQLVLMHWRGIPDPGHSRSHYSDVVEEVRSELAALAQAAIAAGVDPGKLILDPGLGFDKTAAQGWQLLAGLDRLASLGYPLLIGVSRKRMLRETLQAAEPVAAAPAAVSPAAAIAVERLDLATAVVSALAARAEVWGVRVHDAGASADAIAVALAAAPDRLPERVTPSQEQRRVPEPAAPHLLPEPAEPAAGDRISLTGLEVFAHHGVFDFERERGQRFLIDAEVTVDSRAAAASDELARTVNYAELAAAILDAAANDPVDLIETLAERLAQLALGFAGVRAARITVHKPDAPIEARFDDVAVTIVRERGRA